MKVSYFILLTWTLPLIHVVVFLSATFEFEKALYHVNESSGSVDIAVLRGGPLVEDTEVYVGKMAKYY